MAGDMYRKPIAGAPLQIPAKLMGQVIDFARGRIDTGAVISQSNRNPAVIKIRNDSAADLDRYAILGIGDPVILPSENISAWQMEPIYSGETPQAGTHEGKFCVILEAIAKGTIGTAAVAGLVQVRLNGPACANQFADISSGDTGFLITKSGGSAKVIWSEDGNDERWGIISFGSQKKVKARITARTESTCGNSGSGSGDTDHTIYTYALHSVRAVNDGDGCPTFVNDDADVATIIDEAYEHNGNKVAVGTVVDAEPVTYTDESTTSDTVGCRWVFNHEGSQSTQCQPTSSTRTWKESDCETQLDGHRYVVERRYAEITTQNSQGCVTFGVKQLLSEVVTEWCCDPCTGSGTDAACATCPTRFCITLSGFGGPTSSTGSLCACGELNGSTLDLLQTGSSDLDGAHSTCEWFAHPDVNVNAQCSQWTMSRTITGYLNRICVITSGVVTYKWYLAINEGLLCNGVNYTYSMLPGVGYGGLLYLGENSSATVPPTTSGSLTCHSCPGGTNYTGTWTLTAGACTTEEIGSGAGDCPCQWQADNAGNWSLIAGDAGVCTTPPPLLGSIGETRYTYADGSTCTPTDGGGDPTGCSACSFSNGQAASTVTSGGTGFLDSAGNPSMTFQSSQLFIGSIPTPSCPVTSGSLMMWCENNRWYMTIRGSGQAFQATSQDGCSTVTFDLDFTSANGWCPGVAGTAHIVVTLP